MVLSRSWKKIEIYANDDRHLSGHHLQFRLSDSGTLLNPINDGTPKQALAKEVKALAAKYSQYFELGKSSSSIVPFLKMKPEILKTIIKK